MDKDGGHREFLKATIWRQWSQGTPDQLKGVPEPPIQKPVPIGASIVHLPEPNAGDSISLSRAIAGRRSRRHYARNPVTLEELSFLLWAVQGVRDCRQPCFRTVPSAGARHALETYIHCSRVTELDPGLYRYLPLTHELALVIPDASLQNRLARACHNQDFVAEAAAVFVWTAIPYRMEWRYGPFTAKLIALDAGHVCQNLYLACEAINAGACAIAAYDQDAMDKCLGVDGEEEFVTYIAPVGKRRD